MRLLQWNWSWNWSPRPKIHFAIALTVTLLAFSLCVVSFLYSNRQVTQNPIVEGIVVKSLSGADGLHTPIIEFNSPTTGITQFKSKNSSRPQYYFVGDKVEVTLVGKNYKPKLKNFFSVYGISAFLMLSACISAIGTTAIYHGRIKGTNIGK